ncbi:MAG: cysteine hydrolase [Candidatus Aminicenantes bacterium]|nr:cysteine hydrolase [Candidatus Aminicenantes bacterium]
MNSDYLKPEILKSALLTVDVQNDFTLPGAVAEIPGTLSLIPNLKKILEKYRKHKFPIIHAVRLYKPDGSNAELYRRELIKKGKMMVQPNSEGSQLVKDLLPKRNIKLKPEYLKSGNFQEIGRMEWIMYKPRWGAFYKTNLEKRLNELGVNTIIICGCNFPNCPRTTIYEAIERDYKVIFIEDATSGVYKRGIKELRNIGVEVVKSKDFIHNLNVNWEDNQK